MRLLEPWNAWYGLKPPYRKRTGKVEYVVLHHTAGPPTQTPEAIRDYHEKGRGWPHIGYHYLVAYDGTIYKTLPISAVPICVGEYNDQSICIALVGNFARGYPPEWGREALGWKALAELVESLERGYKDSLALKLHKELRQTICPGVVTWEEALSRGGMPSERIVALKAKAKR